MPRTLDRNAPDGFNIFVSPHYDDVAFSIGSLASRISNGVVITCFTTSTYRNDTPSPTDENFYAPETVSAVRKAEDQRFANACGLARLDLGGLDTSVLGRRVGDLSRTGEDVEQLVPLLAPALDRILREEAARPIRLFCPAGFGKHVQHRATHTFVLEWLVARQRNGQPLPAEIFFYEDLPYSSKVINRLGGRWRLAAMTTKLFPGRSLKRIAFAFGRSSNKLDLCGLYASQLKRRPSYWAFSPAALWPPVPHEAIWQMTVASR